MILGRFVFYKHDDLIKGMSRSRQCDLEELTHSKTLERIKYSTVRAELQVA